MFIQGIDFLLVNRRKKPFGMLGEHEIKNLLLAVTRRYSGKYVHLIHNIFNC